MAQQVKTTLIDDITGKEIADGEGENIEFAFMGYTYSIDLDSKNAKKFSESMAHYIDHAQRTGKMSVVPLRRSSGDGARRSSSDFDPAAVRVWAEENGYEVNPRGRIKGELVEAYKAAQA